MRTFQIHPQDEAAEERESMLGIHVPEKMTSKASQVPSLRAAISSLAVLSLLAVAAFSYGKRVGALPQPSGSFVPTSERENNDRFYPS